MRKVSLFFLLISIATLIPNPSHGQPLATIMMQEGEAVGRAMACAPELRTPAFGDGFTKKYVVWHLQHNGRAATEQAIPLFIAGMTSGLQAQAEKGQSGCGELIELVGALSQVIGYQPPIGPRRQTALTSPPASATSRAPTVDVWHSNNGWVQGVCSYQLTFDGQDVSYMSEPGVGIEALVLSVDAFDASGKRLESGTVSVASFGDSDATRTSVGYFEGSCDTVALVIWKAKAVIGEKEFDLLRGDGLVVQESPLKDALKLSIQK